MPADVKGALDSEAMRYATFAIFSVDPGTTTGCARGTFVPVHGGDTKDHLAFCSDLESWEVTGTPQEQAAEIVGEFLEWRAYLYLQLGYAADRVFFVMESFQLRPQKARGAASTKAMLDPVRVGYTIEGCMVDPVGGFLRHEIVYQTPTMKAAITSERLRRLDAWVVGSEHRRDATRHLIVKLRDEMRRIGV
jgi:hypothetical protein